MKAVNVHTVSSLTYSFRINKWSQTD